MPHANRGGFFPLAAAVFVGAALAPLVRPAPAEAAVRATIVAPAPDTFVNGVVRVRWFERLTAGEASADSGRFHPNITVGSVTTGLTTGAVSEDSGWQIITNFSRTTNDAAEFHNWTTTREPDGAHALMIALQANDDSEWDVADTFSPVVVVDNTPPQIDNVEIEFVTRAHECLRPGDTFLLTAQVRDLGIGVDGDSVLFLGFGETRPMSDTGAVGDRIAGDGIFTLLYTVPATIGAFEGDTDIRIQAADETSPFFFAGPNIGRYFLRVGADSVAPDSVAVYVDTPFSYNQTVRIRGTAHDTFLSTVEIWQYTSNGTDTRLLQTVRVDERDTDTTFDFTWRLASEAAGHHQVFAVARDACGNVRSSAEVRITVDTTPPRIDTFAVQVVDRATGVSTPGDITFRDGDSIVITFRTSEPGDSVSTNWFVVDDQFLVGDNTVRDLGNGFYVDTYPTSLANGRPSGLYQIPVAVADTAGNVSTFYVTVILDTTAPLSVVLTRPDSGDVVCDTFRIEFALSEAFEIQRLNLLVDSVVVDTDFAAPWTFDTRLLPEGRHLVSAVAFDTAGNSTQADTIEVISDLFAPDTAAVRSDTPASYRETARLRVSAHDTVALSVVEVWQYTSAGADTRLLQTVRLGEQPHARDTDTAFDYVWRVVDEPAGHHQVFVVARDHCGREFRSAEVRITVDTTPPRIDTFAVQIVDRATGASTPGDITFRPGDSIVITFRASEPGDSVTTNWFVVDDQFLVGDNTVRDLGNGFYVETYPTSNANRRPDGVYSIPVTVTDTAGNASTFYVTVILDSTAPMTVAITRPETGTVVCDTFRIEVAISDPFQIQRVNLLVDSVVVDTDFAAPWTFDTRLVPEGRRLVSAIAFDTAGNSTQADTIEVISDLFAPDTVFVSVDTPLAYNQTVRVRVTAHDTIALSFVEVFRVSPVGTDTRLIQTVRLGEQPHNRDTDTFFDFTWRLFDEPAGNHRIFAVARDHCGRSLASASVRITVDTTAPRIDTIAVRIVDAILGTATPGDVTAANGDTVILTVTLDGPGARVTADFSPLDDAYRAGAEAVTDSGNGQYSVVYRISATNARPNGTYQIPVTAVDTAGNVSVLRAGIVLQRAVAGAPVAAGPSPFVPGDGNPLNGEYSTGILFQNLEAGGSLEIFTVTGRRVRLLSVGGDSVRWNVTAEDGTQVPSGVYFYVAHRPTFGTQRGKLVIIR